MRPVARIVKWINGVAPVDGPVSEDVLYEPEGVSQRWLIQWRLRVATAVAGGYLEYL